MSEINDYEVKIRSQRLISQYQYCQANVDNSKSGNFEKNNHLSSAETGQIRGRSVTQIDSMSSKESHQLQSYLNSAVEDQLRNNYVNSVKKIEQYPSNRSLINPISLIHNLV